MSHSRETCEALLCVKISKREALAKSLCCVALGLDTTICNDVSPNDAQNAPPLHAKTSGTSLVTLIH